MYVSIYVTVGKESEAKQIARTLLEKKLIACANLFPVKSLYYWEDKLQDDEEVGMIIKSQEDLVDQVISEIKTIHSYEVPCIVSWPIVKGNKEYLSWIQSETQTTK
jgi:periplasmic divalent cation tolerance protein